MFSKSDTSLYMIPYSLQGIFFFGKEKFAKGQTKLKINFTRNFRSETTPKFSIHESGNIHIKAGDISVGPLKIPPIKNSRAQHIATICPDDFESLPYFKGTPDSSGAEIDYTIRIKENTKSVRFLIYINGFGPQFPVSCQIVFKLVRKSVPRPLFICVSPKIQDPLGVGTGAKGVTILSGWDPDIVDDSEKDFLYIRGI